MDLARWWNTRGQLGRYGAASLKRGFPRTHHFAQARSVFEVATHRCEEVTPRGCVTLWRLSAPIEDAFDARWEHRLDHATDLAPFYEELQSVQGPELPRIFRDLALVTDYDLEKYPSLRRSAEGRTVPLSGYGHREEDLVR